MTRQRLTQALICFAAMAGLSAWALEGDYRLVVWIFLGGLAVKSYIDYLKNARS